MELLQLRYFVKLAESEHLTHTAESLRISPPSLSASIKKLEKELGVPLFTRKNNRIYLNSNGKMFYQTVKRSLVLLDEGIDALHPLKTNAISIALTSQSVYIEMLYAFEHSHPDIPFQSHVLTYTEVKNSEELNKHDFYLGIIEDLNPEEREIVQLYSSEIPVVMMSIYHPLSDRKSIRLEELQNIPFVSIMQENSSASQFVQRIFKEAHFTPLRMYEGTYMVRQKLVAENKAVAITTMVGAVANALQDPHITFIPIVGVSETRTQSISWNKKKKLTPAERSFVLFAKQYFREHPWSSKGII